MSSISSGVSFWELPNALTGLTSLRQIGRVPPFHMSQAVPLSLCATSPNNSGVEVLAIGKHACGDGAAPPCGGVSHAHAICIVTGDDAGTVTIYPFSDPKWHLCDGSLPCHSYFEVREGAMSMEDAMWPNMELLANTAPVNRGHNRTSRGAASNCFSWLLLVCGCCCPCCC